MVTVFDFQKFYTHCHTIILERSELFRETDVVYQKACSHFGERHKHIEPDKLFLTIKDFAKQFQVSPNTGNVFQLC